MSDTITIKAPGMYYYQVSYMFTATRHLWSGLRTPKPFERGQYLVTPQGGWSRIQEILDKEVEVINHNCVIVKRTMENVRRDIKEGYTRQLNKTEMLLFRMLYE